MDGIMTAETGIRDHVVVMQYALRPPLDWGEGH
jgi:hypothetical protein